MTHSQAATNPTGGAEMRREVMPPALQAITMEAVVAKANVAKAWRRVKSNRGAPGIDGLRIEDFAEHTRSQWPALRQSLLSGTYEPQPVRQVTIPKPGGQGERKLGIPTVLDRVIQQALAQVMTPAFDPGFSASSHGFRPKRSAHGALRQVQQHLRSGYRIAVDLDLAKFFDNVNHDILMHRVAKKIDDKRILGLIGRYLRAGVQAGMTPQPSEIGTVQGGPISPLLANILLDDLDKELEARGHRFARYADDLLVLVKSESAGQRVKASLTRWLHRHLKLPVNEHKSQVAPIHQVTFLGFTFRGTKLRWSDAALDDFKHRIRQLTGRSWGVAMSHRMKKLAEYLRGWVGYFGISQYYRPVPGIDDWIRRRMRMCYWKQWRLTRTKVRELLALGVSKKQAIFTAISGKSYWRLSKTLATQSGMTNDWLKQQGLIGFRDLWIKAQGYT